ncbi:MAG: hypothetical protein GXO75_15355 [Calditrichaeota bacterium]|nr:hypothetical protein [Calditrichota bacterium]
MTNQKEAVLLSITENKWGSVDPTRLRDFWAAEIYLPDTNQIIYEYGPTYREAKKRAEMLVGMMGRQLVMM